MSFTGGNAKVDVSFQRNPVAFDIYRLLGGWATETAYVELNWHGEEYGLYYVGQRIKCGQGRLDSWQQGFLMGWSPEMHRS